MSVYGYPREPEETGEEVPPADLPYRVSSQPVSVPSPSPGPPPEPLLPPEPQGAPYPSLRDLIPTQRPATDPGPPSASTSPAGRPAGPPPAATPSGESDSSSSFEWLRPARPAAQTEWRAPEPMAASAPPEPPDWRTADPTPAPSPVSPGQPGPGLVPSMGQPPAGGSAGVGPAGMGSTGVGSAGVGSVGVGSPGVGSAGVGSTGVGGMGSGDVGSTGVGSPAGLGAASPGPLAAEWGEPGPRGAGITGIGEPVAPAGPVEPTQPRWAAEPGGPTESPWAPGGSDRPGGHTAGVTATAPPDRTGGAPSPGQPPPIVPPPPVVRDEPEIPPWDRKPLLVVIAAAVVLVLIGIVSGMVTAAVASSPEASWREAGTAPTPDPGAEPTEGASAPPPAVAETITVSAVGDVIMGSANLGTPPNNGSGFFDSVRDALAADLVTGNLDMALSDPTGYGKCSPGATDCFQLSLPPSYANVLREGGFHVMSLANNHTQDEGPQGYANTQQALTSVGIQHTGGVDEITYTTVKGVNVALLGFSVYSYTANLNDIPAAVALVQRAAAEADVVVVHMQGGAEGSDRTRVPPAGEHEFFAGEDRGDLRGFAHAVIDAGADVVFGHGPHVMRGMEFYQGRLIAYSLGNFCGYAVLSSAGWSGVGGILKVTLRADGSWAGGTLVPTEMVGPGSPAVDAEQRALAFVDDLSVQDFGPAAARIDHSTGAITAP